MSTLRNTSAGVAVILSLLYGLLSFEGHSNQAYLDTGGIPTICRGHTGDVTLGDYRTNAECEVITKKDAMIAIAAIERLVKVKLSAHTYAALASFVYNVGEGQFANSTLLKKLNAGDIEGACNQLPRWVYDNGVKLRGLVERRLAERDLCLKG